MSDPLFEPSSLSCTVVVCTQDRPEDLARCLAAIQRLIYPAYRFVVVDSAPARVPAKSVAKQFGADYVLDMRGGLSNARNIGAAAATTDIVAYTDDDSIPDEKWLLTMLRHFADPAVAIVTGRILPPPDEVIEDQLLCRYGRSGPFADELRVLTSKSPHWFASVAFGSCGDGANMAFRRTIFEQWPGFNPRFGRGAALHGGEEHLAFVELISLGHKLIFDPASVVYHPIPETRADLKHRLLQARRNATANFMYWLLERPGFRWPTIRILANGVRARIQRVLTRAPAGISQVFRLSEVCRAVLEGVALYLRSVGHAGVVRQDSAAGLAVGEETLSTAGKTGSESAAR